MDTATLIASAVVVILSVEQVKQKLWIFGMLGARASLPALLGNHDYLLWVAWNDSQSVAIGRGIIRSADGMRWE